MNINKKISYLGIDIDTKDKKILDKIQNNSIYYGSISTTPSKHGYHIKIKLHKKLTIKQSLWIRFYIGDDRNRILFDCLRLLSGDENIDVLWNIKTKIKLNEILVT